MANIQNLKSKIINQKLLVERLSSSAKLPTRAYADDAGLDLYSDEELTITAGERAVIKTGIKMAIPKGCAGLIWDKGGVAKNGVHALAGVVDAGYRGEVIVTLVNLSRDSYPIKVGQKIAQILIQKVELLEVKEEKIKDSTERQDKKHGSSGEF